jgi:hypothetical protein
MRLAAQERQAGEVSRSRRWEGGWVGNEGQSLGGGKPNPTENQGIGLTVVGRGARVGCRE